MTKASQPRHIFTAHDVVKAIPATIKGKMKISWKKILAGVCPKDHKIEAVAIKQIIVGYCKFCKEEVELK